MAAIDKLYLKNYYSFDKFRLWCLIHKPSLLNSFYHWNLSEKEWNDWKEYCYNERRSLLKEIYHKYKNAQTLEADYKRMYELNGKKFPGIPIEQLEEEVKAFKEDWEALQNKKQWIESYSLPITNFSCKEDEYLLWHCPFSEIREYLIKQCGYKEKWYYKLFFKE